MKNSYLVLFDSASEIKSAREFLQKMSKQATLTVGSCESPATISALLASEGIAGLQVIKTTIPPSLVEIAEHDQVFIVAAPDKVKLYMGGQLTVLTHQKT